MLSEAIHLIPYALIATLSPLGFAATIAVMQSGRFTALGFGVGVVAGQLLACALLVSLGAVITPTRASAHPTFEALLELAVAVLLLCYALAVHRRPVRKKTGSGSGRSAAALERLRRVHVVTASGIGVLLGVGGPKRLVLTALAAASITAAAPSTSVKVALVGWYTLLATLLVWLPVLAYVLVGARVVSVMDGATRWLSGHRRQATVLALVVVALALVVDALTQL